MTAECPALVVVRGRLHVVLIAGIIVLVVSVIIERITTIRTAQLVNAVGGNWAERDVRYASEGGAPKWLSAIALLSYAGIVVGIVMTILGLL